MNRPQLVRAVYFELRQALAGRASAREILESATALVELFSKEEDDEPRFETRVGGLPFEQWALDAAFADGGWRVMGHVADEWEALAREEAYERRVHNAMVRLLQEMEA